MGAFFTNLQIRAASDDDLARLVSFLRTRLGAQGLAPGEGDALADRTIVIARAGSWTGVYDEGTDSGAEDLEELGATISKSLGVSVLAVRVHDSDVLDLELFESGERRDHYCSAPDYFAAVDDARRRALAGDTSAYRGLLAVGKEEADLRRVFDERLLFAERTLHAIADLVGIDRALVGTGYRYTADGHGPAAEIALRFRSEERPAHEALAEGSPKLGPRYGVGAFGPPAPTDYEVMIGSPAQIAATARNLGGPGVGVDVRVEGGALDSGLVGVKGMNLVLGSPRAAAFSDAILETVEEAGRRSVVGRFPDARIPAGFVADIDELMRARPDKMVEIMHATNVHTNVHLEGLGPGVADLHVTIVPYGAREATHVEAWRLAVTRAAPRPLRAIAEVHPYQLARLVGRTTVFLLVSFDVPRDEAARLAATYAEEWRAVLGEAKKVQATIFHRAAELAPTTKRGYDPATVEATMRDAQVFTLSTGMGPSGGSGLSFGTRILAPPSGDTSCPTLAMWVDIAKAPQNRAKYERILASIAERAVTDGRALQALVGAWGTAPSSLESTPYEEVCGIHGGTLERTWLARFVRAVAAGKLWLGPDLAARVDREALAKVTNVVECGEALRLDVADEASAIHAVETALAPLLPTMDDAIEARRADRG